MSTINALWNSRECLGAIAATRAALVWFGYGLGVERFKRFRFPVLTVFFLGRGLLCVFLGNWPHAASGSTVSNTELSEFF